MHFRRKWKNTKKEMCRKMVWQETYVDDGGRQRRGHSAKRLS